MTTRTEVRQATGAPAGRSTIAVTAKSARARLTFATLVAATMLAAALLALTAFGGGPSAVAAADEVHAAHTAVPPRGPALRQDMRRLWEEHVTWTRMVIVDVAADLPDLPTASARLLRNQADIGRAVARYYGNAAGTRLTQLLRAHILIAGDVLGAAKAGDDAALASAQTRWCANGRQIADFLSRANPTAWPHAEMRRMMAAHLRLTTDEAVARLTGDWTGDVRAFDRVHVQALRMADMLSDGIIAQFPERF